MQLKQFYNIATKFISRKKATTFGDVPDWLQLTELSSANNLLCQVWLWQDSGYYPGSKVHGANMGPIWVLSAPDGPHVGPMNLAIRVGVTRDSCEQSDHLMPWEQPL